MFDSEKITSFLRRATTLDPSSRGLYVGTPSMDVTDTPDPGADINIETKEKPAWEKLPEERTPLDHLEIKVYKERKRGFTPSEKEYVSALLKGYQPPPGERKTFEDINNLITDGHADKYGLNAETVTQDNPVGAYLEALISGDAATARHEGDPSFGKEAWLDAFSKVGRKSREAFSTINSQVVQPSAAMINAATSGGKSLKGRSLKEELDRVSNEAEAGSNVGTGELAKAIVGGGSGSDSFLRMMEKGTDFALQVGLDPVTIATAGPDALSKLATAAAVERKAAVESADDLGKRLLDAFKNPLRPGESGSLGLGSKGPRWGLSPEEVSVKKSYIDQRVKAAVEAGGVERSAEVQKMISEKGPAGDYARQRLKEETVNSIRKDAFERAVGPDRMDEIIGHVGDNAKPSAVLSGKFEEVLPPPDAPKVPVGEANLEKGMQPLQPESGFQKFKDVVTSLKNKASRPYEFLGEGHAPLKEGLRQLQHAPGYAADTAQRAISEILRPMENVAEKGVFNKVVVANDFQKELEAGRHIPFFDTDTVQGAKEFAEFRDGVLESVKGNKNISNALAKRNELWAPMRDEYVKAMEDIGLDVSHIKKNPDYFRHIVMDYADQTLGIGKGQSLRAPTGRSYLKGRSGTTKDILANYPQAEFQVMSQIVKDTQTAKLIKVVNDSENILPKVMADAKHMGLDDWRKAVPPDYVVWNPRQSGAFKSLYPVPEEMTHEVFKGMVEQMGGDAAKAEAMLAELTKTPEMVIHKDVAQTLNSLSEAPSGFFEKLVSVPSQAWKYWALNNPWTFLKYHFRNLTGDAEGAFIGNASGQKKVNQALRELKTAVFGDAPLHGELKEWAKRGGLTSSQASQELGDLASNKALQTVAVKGENPVTSAVKAPFRLMRRVGEVREGTLRYANYLDFLEQLQTGKLKNYGASIPAEIDAIKDIRDKAYKLSNELLGAYDEISVAGRAARKYLFPFWSWKEANAKRMLQLLKNAASGPAVEKVGRSLGAKSAAMAIRLGSFAVRGAALTGTLMAYNRIRYPELEEQLPDHVKNSPHIILGKNADGSIRYIDGLGAMGDILAWFGIDSTIPLVRDWMHGRTTFGQVAKHIAKQPVNQLVQLTNPILRAPVESLTGYTLYPDAFEPRKIRDTAQYLFRQVRLGEEYDKMVGNPGAPYIDKYRKILWNEVDPGKGDYDRILEMKDNFLKKMGRMDSPSSFNERNQALYNYKLAHRYGDKELEQKYLVKYIDAGGKAKGIVESFKSMHPLSGMNDQYRSAFLSTLDADEMKALSRAMTFYNKLVDGDEFKAEESQASVPAPAVTTTPESTDEEAEASARQRQRQRQRMRAK